MDAAIDSICEESVPIEVNITQFVQCVCGHARQLIEKVHVIYILMLHTGSQGLVNAGAHAQ